MKKVIFLTMALALLFLSACSNDDTKGEERGIPSQGDVWLALRINPSLTSRALNASEKETGKPDESVVNTVRVILFDGFDGDALVTNVADLELLSPGTDLLKESKAFKISSLAESILVIVNPSTKLPLNIIPGTSTYADVNKEITATITDVTGTGYDNFMMTNASGLLEPNTYEESGPTSGTVQDNTETTEAAAEGSRLQLTVDRVSAKVRLYNLATSPQAPANPGSDSDVKLMFSDVQWGLNGTNKMFYPVSKRVKTWVEETNGVSTWSAVPYKLGSYREDPNYNSPTEVYDQSGNYLPAYLANYNFVDADLAGNTFAVNWKPATDTGDSAQGESGSNDKNNQEYCLENTQDATLNQHAFTTHVVVRAVVHPSHFKKPDGTYVAYTDGQDWIQIGNGNYTSATLLEWIYEEMVAYYSTDASPALVIVFNNYLNYLESKGVTGVSAVDYDPYEAATTPGSAETLAESVRDEFAAMQQAVSDNGGGSYGGTLYYYQGYNYYTIMIKHDDTDAIINGLGEFGVVRNSVYDIKISAINNTGYPVIPKPDPKKPDEETELFMAVDIEINPWTWYTQTEEL